MSKRRMSPLIEKYYKAWIDGPTLFNHPNDEERFYRFVKACVRYGRKRRNGQWLRHFLEEDLRDKYDAEYTEQQIQNAVSLFDHLVDYENVSFPDHVLEMRDPYEVEAQLERIQKNGGFPALSEEAVNRILEKNFGSQWKKLWKQKVGIFGGNE